MMVLNAYYTATDRIRVRCGVSTFELPKGRKVWLEQVDDTNKKVLVRYGKRDIDWMSLNVFSKCFELL